jgi:RNA polymerase-binding transcription factor DksA
LRSLLDTMRDDTEDEVDTLATFADQRGDRGDEAAEEAALDPELTAQEGAQERRVQIERALERIEAGTYGRCVTCGRPIERERLELVPEASECVKDAGATSARGRAAGSAGA